MTRRYALARPSRSFRARGWLIPLLSAAMLSSVGCARKQAQTPSPVPPAAPALKVEQERFDLELNLYVNLGANNPRRGTLATSLHAQIAAAIDEALARQEPPRAAHALRTLGLMYSPQELDAPIPSPTLAPSVLALYRAAGKRGDEQSAVLAYAVLQVIATPEQIKTLQKDWPDLLSWLESIPDNHERPAFASPSRVVLQTCLAFWPSAWVAKLLRASYQDELAGLRLRMTRARSPSEMRRIGENMGQIYYWLIRVDLRRGALARALAQVEAIKRQAPQIYPQFAAFEPLFRRALDPALQPAAALELLEKLDPSNMDAPNWLLHDSWSTVRTHAERTIYAQGHRVPRAHAHLARALRGQALTLASVPHYQRALTQINDKEMWTELAHAHSESLGTQSNYDLEQAKQHLKEIETFYQEADQRFGAGRIEPGLSDARMRLVHALFEAGQIDQTVALSETSLGGEEEPEALRVLSTIAMHRGDFKRAAQLNERMAQRSYTDPMEQQRWRVVAALLEATRHRIQRNGPASQAGAQKASKILDTLLDLPGLAPQIRGELFMQRYEARMQSEDYEGAYLDLQNALRTLPREPSVYLRAMSEYWLHQRLDDARHVFARVSNQNGLDPVEAVYAALWYLDLAKRLKDDNAQAKAIAFLQQPFSDPWTSALARFALGQQSAEQLRASAKTKTQKIEALFYQGLAAAQQGERSAAKTALDQVRKSEMMALVEYRMATLASRSWAP